MVWSPFSGSKMQKNAPKGAKLAGEKKEQEASVSEVRGRIFSDEAEVGAQDVD